jgi:hypothetical protein
LFEREHHRRIGALLERLDHALLLKHRCLFGGGTALALSRGEYRESLDIDFICSSVDGYRGLRERVRENDAGWIFREPVTLHREPRVDQYGIRFAAGIDAVAVKIEITFEARVELDDPRPEERLCGAWTLRPADLAATKLMANADRYADDAMASRDLIDLAMLSDEPTLPAAGVAKARRAYGRSIGHAFERAKALLLEREGRLALCMKRMKMNLSEPTLRSRIDSLRLDPPR